MRRTAWPLPLLLLLLVAAWAVLSRPAAEVPDPASAGRDTPRSAPTLQGHPASSTPDAARTPAPLDAPATDDADPPQGDARGTLLRVTLAGWTGAHGEQGVVRVTPAYADGRSVTSQTAPLDAKTEVAPVLDVGPLVDQTEVQALRVEVDHPSYLPAFTARVLGEEDRRAEALEVTVELRRARAVRGIVRGSRGDPLGDAWVLLLAMDGALPRGVTRREGATELDETRTRADGRFHLRAPEPGRYALVALSPAHPPATAFVDVPETGSSPDVSIRCPDDVVLAGEVRLDGRTRAHARVVAEARPPAGAPRLRLAGARGWWRNDFRRGGGSTLTGADGRFRLEGLSAGTYEVQVFEVADLEIDHWLLEDTMQVVEAPSDDVVLEIGGVPVTLAVEGEGDEPVTATVVLEGEATAHQIVVESGTSVEVRLRAGVTYAIWAGAAGCHDREGFLAVPPDARSLRHLVRLERARDRGELAVRLHDAAGVPITEAAFSLVRADPKSGSPLATWVEVLHDASWEAGGEALIGNLPAGSWQLTVHAGPGRVGSYGLVRAGAGELWLPVVRLVEIQAERTTSIDLEVEAGGLLEITLRGPEKGPRGAAVRLVGPGGERLSPTWASYGPRSRWSSLRTLRTDGTNVLEEPLPAGRYALAIEAEGCLPIEREVEIRPKEVTRLDLGLEPR